MVRLEHVRPRVVCAMKCGGAPSQPTDDHQSTVNTTMMRSRSGGTSETDEWLRKRALIVCTTNCDLDAIVFSAGASSSGNEEKGYQSVRR